MFLVRHYSSHVALTLVDWWSLGKFDSTASNATLISKYLIRGTGLPLLRLRGLCHYMSYLILEILAHAAVYQPLDYLQDTVSYSN